MSNYLSDFPSRYEVMMGLLPSYYQSSPQMQAIQDALSKEIETIRDLNEKLLDETFVSTSEDALSRYEKMLDLGLQLEDTPEVRRQRIISRLSFQPPLNIDQFKLILNGLVKTGSIDVQEMPGEYLITVIFQPGSQYDYGEITAAVEYAKPAHLDVAYTSEVTSNSIVVSIQEVIDSPIAYRLCNTFKCGEAYS